ncbi:unannotated protein [freshwater metagenome]|uniref:Unannotated protein n=1 Tax=freshwater metagenome TaxID=449393 RepID=A0A6J7QV36_9ZZZZ
MLSVYGMTVADFIAGRAGTAERKRWPDRPVGEAECPDIEQRYAGYVVQP